MDFENFIKPARALCVIVHSWIHIQTTNKTQTTTKPQIKQPNYCPWNVAGNMAFRK